MSVESPEYYKIVQNNWNDLNSKIISGKYINLFLIKVEFGDGIYRDDVAF